MKSFVKIFLLVVVLGLLATAAFAAPAATIKKDKDSVSVNTTHYRDLLLLKAGKLFLGATVEVRDSTGAVIATSCIHKKKMIIDFYDIPYGSYTIQVIKNKKVVLEFNHTKKQDSDIFN
ncbi:MAG: hypothetical protein U0U09_16620 [Cyclobacteriaceae bacterium]